MENILWKLLAFILAVVLMFLAPIVTFYDRVDLISYNNVYSATNEFADISRELGVINKSNYNKFISTLNATGLTYDIEFEHLQKVYYPRFDDSGNPTGSVEVRYEGTYGEDIGEQVLSGGYVMESGDILYVQVSNSSNTVGEVLKSRLLGLSIPKKTIFVKGGGLVHNTGVKGDNE